MPERAWRVLVDALAGYAGARLVTREVIALPVTTRLLDRHLEVTPNLSGLDAEQKAAIWEALDVDIQEGVLDLRALWLGGWASARTTRARYLAQLVSCPACASWWTSLAAGLASGRFRPWRPSSWVDQFATWAIGSTLAQRLAPPPARGPEHYLQEVL